MAVCIIIGFPEAVFTKNWCKIIPVFPLAAGKAIPAPRNESIRDAQEGGPGPGERLVPAAQRRWIELGNVSHAEGRKGSPARLVLRSWGDRQLPLWQGHHGRRVWGAVQVRPVKARARPCRVGLWTWLRFGGVLFLNENVKTVKVEKLHLKLWSFNMRITKTIILEVVSSCVIKV